MSDSSKPIVRIRPSTQVEVGKNMVGHVLSHPFHAAGTEVVTSPVLMVDDKFAHTKTYRYEVCK